VMVIAVRMRAEIALPHPLRRDFSFMVGLQWPDECQVRGGSAA
jgi:hypothetical protein